jgi:hypothetical protein
VFCTVCFTASPPALTFQQQHPQQAAATSLARLLAAVGTTVAAAGAPPSLLWMGQPGRTASTSEGGQPSAASPSSHSSRPSTVQGGPAASTSIAGHPAPDAKEIASRQQQQPWLPVTSRLAVSSDAAAGRCAGGGAGSSTTVVELHLDCSQALSWLDGVPDAAWEALLHGSRATSTGAHVVGAGVLKLADQGCGRQCNGSGRSQLPQWQRRCYSGAM